MLGTWRAALCAAPTILVLAGSLWLANRSRTEAQNAEPGLESGQTVVFMSPADEERMRRVALKHETAIDLLHGRLTFDESVARFWDVTTSSPESLGYLRDGPGGSDEERVVHQLLVFVRSEAVRN